MDLEKELNWAINRTNNNNKAIRNYIILKVVKQLGILYREKEKFYLLVIILGELVLYKDSIINLETELI